MTKGINETKEIINKNDLEIDRLSKLTPTDIENLAKNNPSQLFQYRDTISRLINIKPPIANKFIISALEFVLKFLEQAITDNKLIDTKQEQKSEASISTDTKQELVINKFDKEVKEILEIQNNLQATLEKAIEEGKLKISDQDNKEITPNRVKEAVGNAACIVGQDTKVFRDIKESIREIYNKFMGLGFDVRTIDRENDTFFALYSDYPINPLTATKENIEKALEHNKKMTQQNKITDKSADNIYAIVLSSKEPTKENIETALAFREEGIRQILGLTVDQKKEEVEENKKEKKEAVPVQETKKNQDRKEEQSNEEEQKQDQKQDQKEGIASIEEEQAKALTTQEPQAIQEAAAIQETNALQETKAESKVAQEEKQETKMREEQVTQETKSTQAEETKHNQQSSEVGNDGSWAKKMRQESKGQNTNSPEQRESKSWVQMVTQRRQSVTQTPQQFGVTTR